jgi:hypothetical protein
MIVAVNKKEDIHLEYPPYVFLPNLNSIAVITTA